MLVRKYYVRPRDEESGLAALEEIARYVDARNRLVRLKEKWTRIREEMILPEYREQAATLRATPRTGRKPTKVRGDREELWAADKRRQYAEFIEAGGSYATWWLVEKATKKAVHLERDETAGRAGMLPQWLRWDGPVVHYCGTAWTLQYKQIARTPVPKGRVAQAWLQRERTTTSLMRKPHYVWFLVIVIDADQTGTRAVTAGRTAAGLDIAWRQEDDTLRVAYVADESGRHRSIRMSARQYARMQHAASIQNLADSDANLLRSELGLPANTSHRRLLERAPGHLLGEHLVHLTLWHEGQRRNAILARNDLYLREVHALCAAHHTIYVEKMKGTPNLVQRASTRKKKGAGDDAEGGVARAQRQMASPFEFLRLLQREASKFLTDVIEMPPAYTSRICSACEYDMGASGRGERSCLGCGQRWDVDHLAAVNLLRWGGARKPAETAAE
jgi:hypothetical protein